MRCSRDNGSIHSTHIDANIKKKLVCLVKDVPLVGGRTPGFLRLPRQAGRQGASDAALSQMQMNFPKTLESLKRQTQQDREKIFDLRNSIENPKPGRITGCIQIRKKTQIERILELYLSCDWC